LAKAIYYTAVDIGTNKICSILARVGPEGELKVLGTGITPAQGVQKGVVENVAEAKPAITASLTEAQRYAGSGVITGVYATISGAHINSVNTRGNVQGDAGEDPSDVKPAVLRNMVRSSLPNLDKTQQMLHAIPIGYDVDGLQGVRNPSALRANQVQLETHTVLADGASVANTVGAIKNGKVSVNSLVTQSMASAEAVLTGDERQMGVIVADIGAGTSDVVIYRSGQPWFSTVLPLGGIQLTRDLAVALRVPYYVAEEMKVKFGNVMPALIPEDEEVVVPAFQGQSPRLVKQRGLCEALNLRMMEILKHIMLRVTQAGLRQLPPGGLVITGGTSDIAGLQEMVESVLGGRVRLANPDMVPGLPSQLRKPAFSASVGALLWGIKHGGERRAYEYKPNKSSGYRSLVRRFSRPKENAVG
jgi:cell division protein FtsA